MQQRPVQKVELHCKDFVAHRQDDYLIVFAQQPDREFKVRPDDFIEMDIVNEDDVRFGAQFNGIVTKASYDVGSNTLTVVQRIINDLMKLNEVDTQYFAALRDIIDYGIMDDNRTNKRAQHLFGHQMKFDLRNGFPLITTKYCNTNAIEKELLWFLRGDTNIATLGSKIWDEWATEDGELGPVYPAQWRRWPAFNLVGIGEQKKLDFLLEHGYTKAGQTVDDQIVMFKKIDQIQELVDSLRTNPNNRRNLITAWNPANNPDTAYSPKENAAMGMQALPPCHTMWQVCGARMTSKERLVEYVSAQAHLLLNNADWMRENDIDRQAASVNKTPLDLIEDRVLAEVEELAGKQSVEGDSYGDVMMKALDELNAPSFFLDLQLYQRSADMYLGVPFNIASYALLQMLLAASTNMVARRFIHTLGNYHIYENQFPMIEQQLKETPRALPRLFIRNVKEKMEDYTQDDFELQGYEHGPKLERGEVAV